MTHKWFVMLKFAPWRPEPLIDVNELGREEIVLFDTHADAVLAAESHSIGREHGYEIYKWRL